MRGSILGLLTRVTLSKDILNFRCNKSQITSMKKNQSKYSLDFSYIVLEIRNLHKLKILSAIKCIIGLIYFFQIRDLTFVASQPI